MLREKVEGWLYRMVDTKTCCHLFEPMVYPSKVEHTVFPINGEVVLIPVA